MLLKRKKKQPNSENESVESVEWIKNKLKEHRLSEIEEEKRASREAFRRELPDILQFLVLGVGIGIVLGYWGGWSLGIGYIVGYTSCKVWSQVLRERI